MNGFLRALDERVLVFDGAMGTELMAMELGAEDFGGTAFAGCNEAVVLARPDLIAGIHERYLAAGADVLETDTFTASRLKLDEYGLGDRTEEINLRAAQLARTAADRFSTPVRPRFVAGSLGPTGMLISSSDPALSRITFDELAAIYGEQARYLVAGGVDLLILETSQDLLEMKAAIAGITREFDARSAPRADPSASDPRRHRPHAARHRHPRRLRDARRACRSTSSGSTVLRVPRICATRSATWSKTRAASFRSSRMRVCRIMGPRGETIYPETPDEMARELSDFVRDFGVNAIGGCCGTTVAHVARLRGTRRGPRRAQALTETASVRGFGDDRDGARCKTAVRSSSASG